MAIRTILHYPDKRLRVKAENVGEVTDEIKVLVEDMAETMYAAPGIGLAASQVNVHRRLLVIDVSENKDAPRVFINPEILSKEGAAVVGEEGCLSVPNIFDKVERAQKIRVRSQDRNGAVVEEELEGLLAVCLQHEMDHLAGMLFIDRLSAWRRMRLRARQDRALAAAQ